MIPAERTLSEFEDVLVACSSAEHKPILVAGAAVAFWAYRYFNESPKLRELAPFTTKDLDFLGGAVQALAVGESLGARFIQNPRKGGPTNVVGRLLLDPSKPLEERRLVEFLWSIRGASEEDIRKNSVTLAIEIKDRQYDLSVANPVTLLECKATNAAELDQAERKDVPQLRALMAVLPSFVNDSDFCRGKDKLRFLERVLRLSTSGIGTEIRQRHSVDFAPCVIECIESMPALDLAAARAFVEKRLPQWQQQLRAIDTKLGIKAAYPALPEISSGNLAGAAPAGITPAPFRPPRPPLRLDSLREPNNTPGGASGDRSRGSL